MGFFAFKFLHSRPLAGEGRGEGSEREVARAFLIPTSLWVIFLCLLFNQEIMPSIVRTLLQSFMPVILVQMEVFHGTLFCNLAHQKYFGLGIGFIL